MLINGIHRCVQQFKYFSKLFTCLLCQPKSRTGGVILKSCSYKIKMFFAKNRPAAGSNMMQSFVERQLTDLHNASFKSVGNYRDKVLAFLSGVAFISLLPYLHIGVFYMKIWVPDKPKINKHSCKCSCFDTIFRGAYENPGQTPYKHVYFNATWQTFQIWLFTVIFILMTYESVKYIARLIRQRSIRKSMLLLFLINLYPNYYSWWSYFSYYNEDFYNYYKHHMLFTITEIISTLFTLHLCDNRNVITSWKIFSIISINLVHIFVSGMDQFISHVLQGRGTSFQNARDIGLMVPDTLHIIIPALVLVRFAKRKELRLNELCNREEVLLCVLFITLGTLFGRLL